MNRLLTTQLCSMGTAALLLLSGLSSATAAPIQWTGAASDTWANPGNWDLGLPAPTDDVFFNAAGTYPSDLQVQLDVGLIIGTLNISGDFDPAADYNFQPLERLTNQLTVAAGLIAADFPTTGSTNKNIELDSNIGFLSSLTILRTGTSASNNRRLVFNRGLSESLPGLNVTIRNDANGGREAIRFRDQLDWTGTTTIARGWVDLQGNRVDPTFGETGSLVLTATEDDTTIRMIRNTAAGDATSDNDFQLGTAGDTQFFTSGSNATTETWTLLGDFTAGSTTADLAFDMSASDSIRLAGVIDVSSRLVIETPAGATLGEVLLDGQLLDAEGGVLIENNATLSGSGDLDFRIDNGSATSFGSSPIDVDGTLDITSMNLNIVELNGGVDGLSAYVIADYSDGQLVGSEFASVSGTPAGYRVRTNANGGTQVVLELVPEPHGFATCGLWIVALLLRHVDRRRRA
ncbi:MAG: hypothetical protein AAGF97_07625 [Planctomycetota bacterium]